MARPNTRPNPADMADEIADRLVTGESLDSICRDEDMPASSSVYRELHRNAEFGRIIACAREAQQDYEADHIVQIADEATPETVQVAKLRCWARTWRASHLAPKKFGKAVQPETPPATVNQTINVALLSQDERDMWRALAMKAIAGPKVIKHEPNP